MGGESPQWAESWASFSCQFQRPAALTIVVCVTSFCFSTIRHVNTGSKTTDVGSFQISIFRTAFNASVNAAM
jgi:hypothetical protein